MEGLGINLPGLLAQLVNFALLFILLYLVAYKPVLRLLDQRSARIKEGLEAADRAKEEAARSREEMQRQLEESRREGQALIDKALESAERVRQEEQARARQQAETFVARARADIQRERDDAIEEVRRQFSELAILAAERVINRSLDRQAHRDLIEQVLEESGTLEKQ